MRPQLQQGNLALTLERWSAERGWTDRVALRIGDESISHGEVHELSARMAGALSARGVARGARVLIAAADSLELAITFLGAIRIGALAITINPGLTRREHAAFVETARPDLVVADAEIADRFGAAPLVCTDVVRSDAAVSSPAPAAPLAPDAPAYVQYTSGTTGVPKGAVHRHGDPLVYYDAVARGVYGMVEDDVVLCISKMFFAFGLPSSLLHPLLAGASAVLHPTRPTPDVASALVARHGVTILLGVPTFYAALVDRADSAPFVTTRLAISGGEPLLPRLKHGVEALLGCPMLNHLGSTEVGHGYVGDTLQHHRPGTAGVPLPPYRVEVRDATGVPVGPLVEGQVWVSGPTLMSGYLDQPEASAAVLVDGWFGSGDAGFLDADGYLALVGRADDIEIVAGHKVWPGEIERVLGTHEAVTSVAVVGRPGERGSVLHALIVCAAGHRPTQELVDELVERARLEVAPFKVPRQFVFLDQLPLTPTGKLQRFRVRRELDELIANAPTFTRRADWSAPVDAAATPHPREAS